MEIHQCWLCGDGQLSDEVFLTQNEHLFSDCLWEVYVQCQYSASKEFAEAQDVLQMMEDDLDTLDSATSASLHDKLAQLRRAARSEDSINRNLMAMKLGKTVNFGDVIQFRHLKSRKFLTVSMNQMAKLERENIRVLNDERGASLSSMTLVPKSRGDKEGSQIKSGAEVFVRIQEKSSEYLRAVKKAIPSSSSSLANGAGERFEINCSPELTAFRIVLFQPRGDLRDKPIMTHWLVTMQDHDSASNMTVIESADSSEAARVVTTPLSGRNPEYQHLYVGTEFLWSVEKDVFVEGGLLPYGTQRVAFRHFNSGLFLKLDSDGTMVAVKNRGVGTMFEIHNGSLDINADSFLYEGGVFLISTAMQKKFLCTTGTKVVNRDETLSTLCEGTIHKSNALRLVPSKSVFLKAENDVYYGMMTAQRMRAFVSFAREKMPVGSGMWVPPEVSATASSLIKGILSFVDALCTFLGGSNMDHEAVDDPLRMFLNCDFDDVVEEGKISIRQVMMMEQGVLDAILDILDLCAVGTFDQVKIVANIAKDQAKPQIGRSGSVREIIRRDSTGRGAANLAPTILNQQEDTKSTKSTGRKGSNSDAPSPSLRSSRSESNGDSTFKAAIQMIGTSFRGSVPSPGSGPYKVGAKDSDSDSDSDEDSESGSDADAPLPPPTSLKQSPQRMSFKAPTKPSAADNQVKGKGPSEAASISLRRNSAAILNNSSLKRGSTAPGSLMTHNGNRGEKRQTVSKELAEAMLRILLLVVKNNHMTQLHVSSRIKVILDQVTSQILAVKTLRELLRDNLRILQTKITQNDINLMSNHLRDHEMNVTFLKLLQSTCSCPRGVDSTQRMVALSFYGDSPIISPMLIDMIMDGTSTTQVSWETVGNAFRYIPIPFEPSQYVMGSSVLAKGLPKVFLRWNHGQAVGKDMALSMKRLFGIDDRVAIEYLNKFAARRKSEMEELFSARRSFNNSKRSIMVGGSNKTGALMKAQKKNSISPSPILRPLTPEEVKCQIADYLVTQLYLVADLCLDRNYVSIRLLETLYQYELLITLLKREDISNAIKAPVSKIVRTLWVDREPQVATVFPNLIRSPVNQDGEQEKQGDKKVSRSFSIVQHIISEYLWTKLNEGKRDEYSFELLELLHSLMMFGFYSSDKKQLQDVMIPIVRALDSRKHAVSKSGENDNVTIMDENIVISTSALAIEKTTKIFTKVSNFVTAGASSVYNSVRSFSFIEYWNSRRDRRLLRASRNHSKNKGGGFSQKLTARMAGQGTEFEYWEERILNFLESITGMLLTLTIVLVTCSMAISQIYSDDTDPVQVEFYDTFEIVVTTYFCTELFIRIYCSLMTHADPTFFFHSVFNFLDFSLVALDLILIGLKGGAGLIGAARITRAARVLRILRLLRILRAVRLLKKIADANRALTVWKLPKRYSSLTELDVKTTVSMLKILSLVYNHIQDQELEVVCKAFYEWNDIEREGAQVSPIEVYKKCVAEAGSHTYIPKEFDMTLLDVLMYSDVSITKEALQLLMMHKNSRHIMYTIVQDIQIIYSPKVEDKLHKIKSILRDLQRMTEMYEIWHELETEDHEETCAQMLEAVKKLEQLMRKPNEAKNLVVEDVWLADEECQKIARNMRAINCIMMAYVTLYDGGREELHPEVIKILKCCSLFIKSFVFDCPRNQMDAVDHLPWFIEHIDCGFDTHLCVKSILHSNPQLISECNSSFINLFAQKIATNGRKPSYLSLYLGLVEERPFVEHVSHGRAATHNEVGRICIGKEWKHHILLWCACSPDSKAFKDRSLAMSKFKYNEHPPLFSELSEDLAYHVLLLRVLRGCQIGQRLQAVYPLDYLIEGILDPNCIPDVKIGLGGLLVQILESGVDNIDSSESMWRFFEKAVADLEQAMTTVKKICSMQFGELSILLKVQMRQWLEVILDCVMPFFVQLDLSIFGEAIDIDTNLILTSRSEQDVMKIMKSLYVNIRQLMESCAFEIGFGMLQKCGFALLAIVPHSSTLTYDMAEMNSQLEGLKKQMKIMSRAGMSPSDTQQLVMRKKFLQFSTAIMNSEDSSIFDDSVLLFSKVPLKSDPRHSDVRFDTLLQKFYVHVHGLLIAGELSGQRNTSVDQAIWILKSMRIIMERESVSMKDSSSPPETPRAVELRAAYMENNLVKLCIECCSVGINTSLNMEAIHLLVVLLSRRGGCIEIQRHMYDLLNNSESSAFFKLVDHMLTNIITWCKREIGSVQMRAAQADFSMDGEGENEEEQVVELPTDVAIFKLLKLMCNGDFHPLKGMMRSQERNTEQINIIAKLCVMADLLSRHEMQAFTSICLMIFKAIRNIIYGLNKGNQEFLILQTEVLPSINRFMRASRGRSVFLSSSWSEEIDDLKEVLLDVIICAIEGHSSKSAVVDRIVSTIELNVLSAVLVPHLSSADETTLDDEPMSSIEAKYLTLLQALGKTSEVLTEIGAHRAYECIAFVEVIRDTKLHVLHFPIPDVVEHLSREFVQQIADNLDVSSQENKLNHFMRKIKSQFIETRYQGWLKPYGLALIWAWRERIQWFMFVVSVVINCLILAYYEEVHQVQSQDVEHVQDGGHGSGGGAYFGIADPDVQLCVESLAVVQVSLAALVLFLYCFIRVPASFVSLMENGATAAGALGSVLLDMNLLWRGSYLVFAVIGLGFDYIFLTVLLLDWVALDATTRQVLKAVQYPFRQLMATLIIIVISLNIFAGAYFVLFAEELEHGLGSLTTMFEAFKLSLSYGFRGEYGMGHEFHFSLGSRLILDVAFYMVIMAVLRNSFMAIILDTFAKLREVEYERNLQASNSCFICGVEKHDYDKMINPGTSSTFGFHRSVTHRTENYIYFVLSIWSQPPHADNGLQMYIRNRIIANDTSWFPIGIISNAEVKDIGKNDDGSGVLGIDGAKQHATAAEEQLDRMVDMLSSSPQAGDRQQNGASPAPPGTPTATLLGKSDKNTSGSSGGQQERDIRDTVYRETIDFSAFSDAIRSQFSELSRRLDDISSATGATATATTKTTTNTSSAETHTLATAEHRHQAETSQESQQPPLIIRPSPQRAVVARPWGESPYSAMSIRSISGPPRPNATATVQDSSNQEDTKEASFEG